MCTGALTHMLQNTVQYICLCATPVDFRLYREGSAAPAFVPNRKQTHKEQRRGGKVREGGGREQGKKRWEKQEDDEEEKKKRNGGVKPALRKYVEFRTLLKALNHLCLNE